MKIIVHPFPWQSRHNKYLELLHGALIQDKDLEITGLSLFKLLKETNKNQDKHIIHIHWQALFYGSRFFLKSVLLLMYNFSLLIFLKYLLGHKIVWTLHNFHSHDAPFPLIDRIGYRFMWLLADGVIVQQKSAIAELVKKHPNSKITYIPHGNYIGAYGPVISRKEDFSITLISLGMIRPYKKNENIISAFREARKQNQDLRLIIAGSCKPDYAHKLKELIDNDDAIVFENKFIEDSEIPIYLSKADYAIFWYDDSVLTSGGIMLALSYGLPVIARDISAAENINESNGFKFQDHDDLVRILSGLSKNRFSADKIINSVENVDWSGIASRTADFYKIL